MKGFTIKQITELQNRGMIKDVIVTRKTAQAIRLPKGDCAQVQWMHHNLHYFCKEINVKLEKEFRFDKMRKFRFDFCIPSMMIAFEYEGLNSEKSAHTTFVGYTENTVKYNMAAKLGYTVLRYTAANYKNVLQDLKEIIEVKKSL